MLNRSILFINLIFDPSYGSPIGDNKTDVEKQSFSSYGAIVEIKYLPLIGMPIEENFLFFDKADDDTVEDCSFN